jgi:hypothetical protein
MSLAWDDVTALAHRDDRAGIVRALATATPAERKAAFPVIAAEVKAMTREPDMDARTVYALAVVGTAPTAAKAIPVLRRAALATWNWGSAEIFLTLTAALELPWTGELGYRLAERLPARNPWPDDWIFAAALMRGAGVEPPVVEGVVRSWVRGFVRPWRRTGPVPPLATRLRQNPWRDLLLPAVFDIDTIGAEIGPTATVGDKPRFPAAVAALARDGVLERKTVLASVLDRFLRGGRPNDLRGFTLLHDELAPTVDEMSTHALDYAQLLAAGPGAVASVAQRSLRAVDDAGRLDLDTVLGSSAETLLRPEKTLVKAQLTWLDKLVRREPGRAAEVVVTIAGAFGHAALDVQEKALDLVTKHRSRLDPAAVDAIAAAAPSLGGDLPARAALLFPAGEPSSIDDERAPHLAPPAAVAEMPAPVADAAELAEELAGLVHEQSAIGWERVLAGLVSLYAAGDREALAEMLLPVVDRYPGWFMPNRWNAGSAHVGLGLAIRFATRPSRPDVVVPGADAVVSGADAVVPDADAVVPDADAVVPDADAVVPDADAVVPDAGPDDDVPAWAELEQTLQELAAAVRIAWQEGRRGQDGSPFPLNATGVLALRAAEVAVHLTGTMVPMTVATPTHVNGSLAAETLLDRLSRAEAEGWQPWQFDFEQALLRVPRATGDLVVARAAKLTSPAGRQFAQWLASGGLPDPVSEPFTQPGERGRDGGWTWDAPVPRRMVASLRPSRDGGLRLERQLLTLTPAKHPVYMPGEYDGTADILAMVLPHHREVAAAWALADIASTADQNQRDAGRLLPLLADCDGPVGPAMAYALAYSFAAKHEPDRAAATDTFLALTAALSPRAGGGASPDGGGSSSGGEGLSSGGGGGLPSSREGSPPGSGAGLPSSGEGLSASREGLSSGGGGGLPSSGEGLSASREGLSSGSGGGLSFASLVGVALADLGGDGTVKLTRVLPALTDMHRAGAAEAVWELLVAALPPLLTTTARAVPDLLEIASQVAVALGVKGDLIPGLAEVSERSGSTRVVKEAKRLRSILAA